MYSSVYLLLSIVFVGGSNAHDWDSFESHHSEPRLRTSNLDVGEYCATFHENYVYYCRGIWTAEKLLEHRSIMKKIGKFCPSYKSACVTRTRIDPEEERERKEDHKKELTDDVGDMAFDDLMRKLEKIVPCRPNCNVSVHPHCTRQCKCEYEYHRMQKWCKPPRIEERFKYFCRIWYMSCSTYIEELDPEMADAFVSQYANYGNYHG
ncbi:Delta and osm-11 homolog protein 1 [Caenorhabditis elegans]|uniref:Delta and osm-11 homolog protein 1 n=1 Tax=Caenorhabditis elegans TaxID=6239 RepID=DOS1_CAEEL|nr:Delta and osm-11 homolog protein 1 [Caenorhabditis elegans]P34636.2 RecName: Full=Delta and osm-11 homolog protein 1 [Caenorhabditis elegans]CAA82370.2 Delta and osm-11 homolog protein 1 [Caenorhabditis elegans]|eukprot:NP_499017.2 Delta and osm-11 homolog protein 1 [Caenorhabditis elegans]